MKITFSIFRSLAVLICIYSCFVLAIQPKDLTPSKAQSKSSIEIITLLERKHFEKKRVDSPFSKKFLENYIEAIDSNKQVFLQGQVDQLFSKYSDKINSDLKKGNLQPAFDIFTQYQTQLTVLLNEQLKDLDKKIQALNFTTKETFIFDRTLSSFPKSELERKDIWHKRLKSTVLSMKLDDKDDQYIIKTLTKRYKNQLDRLNKINSEDVFQIYMNTLTQAFDPHTNYMSPNLSKNFNIAMSLKLQGIGALLRMKDDYTEVVRLIPGGPAAKKGGLFPSDKIVGVAQGDKGEMIDITGWRLDEVVELIRGEKGSLVRLEVIPAKSKDENTRKVIKITRDEVKLEEQSVKKAMLEIKDEKGVLRKVGVLNIPTFYIDFEAHRKRIPNYKSTTRDAHKLLQELLQEGAEGIVVDLRNNGGGSLKEANDLTGLFIDKGPSVQIKSANGHIHLEQKPYYVPYYTGPLVVLVNRMSASASEIFAGAIQDYNRGLIIGSNTFGKGTVQSLTPLSHGRLKITESKFYRVSGESTQNKGVIPDIALPPIFNSKHVGENASKNAMKWDAISSVNVNKKTFYNIKPLLPSLTTMSQNRIGNESDFIYNIKRMEFENSLDTDKISLNLEDRLKKKKNDELIQLNLINEKRKSKNKPPFKDFESMETALTEEAEQKAIDNSKIDVTDAYIIEASNILIQMKEKLTQNFAIKE